MWTGSKAAQGTPNCLNHSEQLVQHTHDVQKWPAVGVTQPGEPWVVPYDQKTSVHKMDYSTQVIHLQCRIQHGNMEYPALVAKAVSHISVR
jgi:hypothetical protein